ncbi:DUF1810 domain-containing protein [Lichenifustis flavocetrariae]|uniref:DUF1810 domain-containing protein n=1 Tax=Lichenifustis flavocetrariae TaxID=2949735 RepID=A0AA42CM23_9HYPH|nr:DUF1810 domain-containing protein [Lichenifustis flavocetrariae]MCW6512108.1 DUF1810 domain-containing protein [Lichenifustis flavocetrariae]
MDDPYHLNRFVSAQDPVYDRVRTELQAGRKTSHWMWFVFPQIAGLGHSPMAQRYAIGSLAEAKAFLQHPLLGPRLETCTGLVNHIVGRSARSIFGTPDDLKFRSSMTLFAEVADKSALFSEALTRFYDGKPDPATLARLAGLDHEA